MGFAINLQKAQETLLSSDDALASPQPRCPSSTLLVPTVQGSHRGSQSDLNNITGKKEASGFHFLYLEMFALESSPQAAGMLKPLQVRPRWAGPDRQHPLISRRTELTRQRILHPRWAPSGDTTRSRGKLSPGSFPNIWIHKHNK